MPFSSPSYLDLLNPQQRAAVEYIDGPQLVIAGAGSGKTRVLTYKIVHLLANGYEPWRILALTFTNKAAREMRDRITTQIGQQAARRIWMGTFHSVFARILRSHAHRLGFPSNFTIYDAQDASNLVKNIIKQLNLDEKAYKASTITNIISAAKNALQSPDDYLADSEKAFLDKKNGRPLTGRVYQAYCNRLRTSGAMDFDDLLFHTYRLLRDNADIRNHYNEFFRYVLVDEYQDTNYAQHAIIELLTGATRHLCVVGDDAQSIYSFRGANLANILGLNRIYPDLRMFKLEQNFRSTENIINAAGSLIAKNVEQIPKNVFSTNGAGNRVEVVQCFSDFEEAGLLASRIAEVKSNTGDSYEDFAVLYRTNAQSRILEESLRKRNIPYRIYGGLSFFQRKEVKDAVAYLRLALNPADEAALRRIINVPARKLGDTTVKKVVDVATENNVSLFDVLSDMDRYPVDVNRPTRARLESFADMVRNIANYATNHDAAETLEYIYVTTGLIELYTSDTTPENISKRENLAEFNNYATQFVELKREQGLDDEVSLASFMAEVSLATDADKNEQAETDKEAVTLMTIHSAKGLEFGNVFVVGVEKNLLPSMMSMSSPREIEEERRLLYVAITRAKRFCMLSYASSRYINGQTTTSGPSPFLKDIDPKYLKLATGTNLYSNSATPPRSPSSAVSGYGRQLFDRFRKTNPAAAGPSHLVTERPASTPQRVALPDGTVADLHTPAELSVGNRIFHPRFNRGVISNIDADHPQGARITVEFDSEGTKILLLRFAKFVLLN